MTVDQPKAEGRREKFIFPLPTGSQVPKFIMGILLLPPAFLNSYRQNVGTLEVRYLQIQNLDFFSENQNICFQDLIHKRSSFYILLNKAPDKSQNVLI
ncbi:hypothetical protein CEN39_06375 [Fischerella thermalis CCMEE 5201]|nr:hypothetical protein CEN39_06375 [Fischerella thermalis CCMEE 5201]